MVLHGNWRERIRLDKEQKVQTSVILVLLISRMTKRSTDVNVTHRFFSFSRQSHEEKATPRTSRRWRRAKMVQ